MNIFSVPMIFSSILFSFYCPIFALLTKSIFLFMSIKDYSFSNIVLISWFIYSFSFILLISWFIYSYLFLRWFYYIDFILLILFPIIIKLYKSFILFKLFYLSFLIIFIFPEEKISCNFDDYYFFSFDYVRKISNSCFFIA